MERKEKAKITIRQTAGIMAEVLKQERTEIKANRIMEACRDHTEAVEVLQNGRESIRNLIASNRGGNTGIHGFVAEHLQVFGSNAMSVVEGEKPRYRLIDDNGPVDYLRDNTPIQLKACNPGNKFGLNPVRVHNRTYPEFSQSGGIYQVPKDNYTNYLRYLDLDSAVAGKLRRSEFRMWKNAYAFAEECPDITLEPMIATYGEVQVGNIEATLDSFEERLVQKRDARIDEAVKESRASLGEGFKVTAFSAAFEGCMDGVMCVIDKTNKGTALSDFSKTDWMEVGDTAAKSAGKGAIRGALTYVLANGVGISGPIASAGITTSFGIAADVKDYRSGEYDAEQLKTKVGEHIVDGAVSAGSSLAAMTLCTRLIPIGGPYGKAIQISAGLIGNYLGSKGVSSIRNRRREVTQ